MPRQVSASGAPGTALPARLAARVPAASGKLCGHKKKREKNIFYSQEAYILLRAGGVAGGEPQLEATA